MVSQVCFERRWDYGDQEYAIFHKAIEKIMTLNEVLGLVDFLPMLGFVPKRRAMSVENDCLWLVVFSGSLSGWRVWPIIWI